MKLNKIKSDDELWLHMGALRCIGTSSGAVQVNSIAVIGHYDGQSYCLREMLASLEGVSKNLEECQ